MDRIGRRPHLDGRTPAGALRPHEIGGAGAPPGRERAPQPRHALRQHDPRRGRALLPGGRSPGAPVPTLGPLERRRHGHPPAAPGPGRRRPHLVLRGPGHPLRGRTQPFLPRQGPSRRGRPGLLPGPLLSGELRARLPRGPLERGGPRLLPPTGFAPLGRPRPALLPPPPPAAGLLGVPHRVAGDRPGRRDLPGVVQQIPGRPGHQGHRRPAGLVLPGRRGNGRARVSRASAAGRHPGPRQPDLRRQLQPAAPGRPGPRQRQDHPGARSLLQGSRLERRQSHLGPRMGCAPPSGQRPCPRQSHERDARRRLPGVPRQRRSIRARLLLRTRPAHEGHGLRLDGRADLGAQARRARLPQGVRRLPGRDRVQGPADRHPRAHRQRLRAGHELRGPTR